MLQNTFFLITHTTHVDICLYTLFLAKPDYQIFKGQIGSALIRVERRGHWMAVLESSFCWVDMTPCLKKTSFSCWRMICKNDMDVRTDNIYVTDTEINVL